MSDLGEKRRIWGVRRTKVRRAPKSAIEKARINMENFEEIQPITVSFSDFLGKRDFFLFSTGFFGLVKCDSPFYSFIPFQISCPIAAKWRSASGMRRSG